MSNRTLSSVVEKELNRLCLRDFPCGRGSWSKLRTQGHEDEGWGYRSKGTGSSGPATEGHQDLIELLTSPLSPWRQEAKAWSPQAEALRELSVTSPRLSRDFLYECFTTLRIADKGVSVIDERMLRFTRLEELILTANHISELPGAHLPKSLRVLEVCANQVSSLKTLSRSPPPALQHLGLGYNPLSSASDARLLSASHWPELVSLDLSWCGFVEQLVLVDSLSSLPQLRALSLEGNPLTLSPSYPAFLLSSLPKLLHIDGRHVTSDDHHRFHGLAKRRDDVADEAVVTVTVHRIRGVPDSLMLSDGGPPEFPLVTCSYLVTYDFLESLCEHNKVVGSERLISPIMEDSVGGSRGPESRAPAPKTVQRSQGEEKWCPAKARDSSSTERCSFPVTVTSTPKKPWVEPIELEHAHVHRIRDLLSLKSFFLRGLCITVEEEKVLSWPASPGENMGTKPAPDRKGSAKERARTSDSCSSQKSKEKRRKREPQIELVQDPPVRRTLGSAVLDLQDLLSGGTQLHRLCDLGEPTERGVRTPQEEDPIKTVKEDKKKEDKRAKPAGESITTRRTAPSGGKNRGKKASEAEDPADTIQNHPQPLVLEISVRLDKWSAGGPTDV
ncbi:hypothetical protein GJAV_G00036400 [Gymnothorax javanicus]|nr:hypothetical protein GJAV_G00036400 [Gymnothorax javanicus]